MHVQPVADTSVGTDKTCSLRDTRSAEFLLSFLKHNYNCRTFLRYKKNDHANLKVIFWIYSEIQGTLYH